MTTAAPEGLLVADEAALLGAFLQFAIRRDHLATVLYIAHDAPAFARNRNAVRDGRKIDPRAVANLVGDRIDRARAFVHRLLLRRLAFPHAGEHKLDPRPGREVIGMGQRRGAKDQQQSVSRSHRCSPEREVHPALVNAQWEPTRRATSSCSRAASSPSSSASLASACRDAATFPTAA